MRLSFDRGTLLLDCREGTPHVAQLRGVRWDARVRSYRAPAFCYADITEALRAQGLSFHDQTEVPSLPIDGWGALPLRPYQHTALVAWNDAGRRGLLVLPTGSGKTRLACAAMALTRARVLCLVPTRALLHQWRRELAQHYTGPIGCLGDGHQELRAVTVTTFESAYRHMERIGNAYELLVVDEVHHFGNGLRDEALELCAAPWRLGLTATPPKHEALIRITDRLGPVVCELRVADLAGTWLAEYECVLIQLRLNAAERERYRRAIAAFRTAFEPFRALAPDASWSTFVALASRSERGRTALAAFRESRRITHYPLAKQRAVTALLAEHRDARVLVFTGNNETAYAIAREHLIMPITCDIDRSERESALAAFRQGELRALVSAQVLNEGVDVPDADVAIIVGGVRGEREHVQRVGRLLRPVPGKRAVVYELVTLNTHEVRAARERRRSLEPVGRAAH